MKYFKKPLSLSAPFLIDSAHKIDFLNLTIIFCLLCAIDEIETDEDLLSLFR